jgi:hypothetical protein
LLDNDTESDVETFLDHHGVKGQKWGIRNKEKASSSHPTMSRKDKRWKKNMSSMGAAIDVHNTIASRMNNGLLDTLNRKHAHLSASDWDEHDNPITKASRAYMTEYNSMVLRETEAAYKKVHGTSPSGNFEAGMDSEGHLIIKPKSVHHATDDTLPTFIFEIIRDTNGQIVSMRPKSPVQHSTMSDEEFIDHHGVKGQKWGIRNRKNRVKVPSSSEHKKAAALRKKPVHSLTNEQLKELNTRGNLERQHSQLNPSKVASGKKRAEYILGTVALGAVAYNMFHSPAGQAAISLGKKAARKNLGKHAKLPF